MSTSSVSSSASRLVREPGGEVEHLARADVDDLRSVLAEQEAELALEDVGQLLVLVRVLRDDAALVEEDLRQHHPLGRDQLPRQVRLQLLLRHVVPAVVRRLHSSAPSFSIPSSICASSTRLNESRTRVGAAAVREEERAGDDPDALLDRAPARSTESAPPGSVSQEKKPPCGRVQRTPVRASSARAPRAGARPCAGRAPASASAARRSSRGARTPRRAAGRARPRTGR